MAWAYSWDDAVAAAKKLPNGRILLSFVDEDCGECRRMDALVVPSTSFWAFTRDKIPLRVVRATPEGKRLTERFRIPEVPAWLVVTPDMVVSGAQIGSTTQQGWVDAFIRSEQAWAAYRKKLDAEAANSADDTLVFDVAKETFKRGGDNLAEPRFRRLASAARRRPGSCASRVTRTSSRSRWTPGGSTKRRRTSTSFSRTRRIPC